MIITRKTQSALVLALAGTVSASAATYNGDLIVGFTKGSQNDVIYDLGPASALVDGKTWDLNTQLSGFNLNNVSWGVFGDKTGTPRVAWTTVAAGFTPLPLSGNAAWGQVDTPTRSIYQNFTTAGAGNWISIASSDDNGWNQQAIVGALSTQYHNAYEDPTVTGLTAVNFFEVLANGSTPTQLGTFTLGADGVLTYHTVSATPVPPPPPVLAIARVGDTSTISFGTTNGAIYTLCFTNATGLTSPVTNWPLKATTINGNGATNAFVDVTTDTNRFYRVIAH